MCRRGAELDPSVSAALDRWAQELGCSCVDTEENGHFVRIWLFAFSVAVAACMCVAVPLCFSCGMGESEGQETPRKDADDGIVSPEAQDDDGDPEPNIEKALRHQRTSMINNHGDLLPVRRTSLEEIGTVAGIGIRLYFQLLRDLGVCFTFMAALTLAGVCFNSASSFAPDNGHPFTITTIGNIGTMSLTGSLRQEQRYLVLKYRGRCQGMPVAEMTAWLGWLDFCSILILLVFVMGFRFVRLGQLDRKADREAVTASHFAIEIGGLPRRFDGMHEVDEQGRTQYERELREFLCRRAAHCRRRERGRAAVADGEEAPPKVEELVLVRDYEGRLRTIVQKASVEKQCEIKKYLGHPKAVGRLQAKAETLQAKLERTLAPDEKLDVLRAFVVFGKHQDAARILFDFRLSASGAVRFVVKALGWCGLCECCCPLRARLFRGHALWIRRAPEPSTIIWENRDISWLERHLRRLLMGVVVVLLLAASLYSVYLVNYQALSLLPSTRQLLGDDSCDPNLQKLQKLQLDRDGEHQCYVQEAATWTLEFVEDASDDQRECYCGAVGYKHILRNPDLVRGVCRQWVLRIGKGIAVGIGCTLVVVSINVLCQQVLMFLADLEKPRSYSSLHKSKMFKLFVLQTLNTGFVILVVNFSPPHGSPLSHYFVGEYDDAVRGWYAVVGTALLSNMTANMVTPAFCDLGAAVVRRVQRWICILRVHHQAELIELYKNPEFDLAAKYAQLLTTVYVTVAYSSGMPALNIIAAGYMLFTYWSDKVSLLRESQRPPRFDARIPKDAVTLLIYAPLLHCLMAIWMLGQPCTFPSRPVGGRLRDILSSQVASYGGAALSSEDGPGGGVLMRSTRESTWMFLVLSGLLVGFWMMWTIVWVLGGTMGGICKSCIACLWFSRPPREEDAADDLDWTEASKIIQQTCPPASYRMERHPDFKQVCGLLHWDAATPDEIVPNGKT